MFASGASREERDDAKRFAEVDRARAHAEVTDVQATRILEGTFEGTWVQPLVGPSLLMYRGDDLHFVSRYLATSREIGFEKARHYLLGLSAFCAFATRGAVTGDFGADGHVKSELDRIRRDRPDAIALGGASPAPFSTRTGRRKNDAAGRQVTWSTLRTAERIWTGSRDTARRLRGRRRRLRGQMDQKEFDLLVSRCSTPGFRRRRNDADGHLRRALDRSVCGAAHGFGSEACLKIAAAKIGIRARRGSRGRVLIRTSRSRF